MTLHLNPDRQAHARRVLAHAEANAEGLLIHPRDLKVSVGRDCAGDMRNVAELLRALGGKVEATLNLAVKEGEFPHGARDCRDCVDTITEAFAELAGFFESAAEAIAENDALPIERERD